MHARGFRALVIDCDETLAGYATLGRGRAPGPTCGEIYELYVRPECQGCGLGRRLFSAARRELRAHGYARLTVWALADNTIACRFYRAMGGAEFGRTQDRFCGVPLAKIGFSWR
jgi:ribosomal protein S18 acetylase RimI-like enzyme